MNKDDFIKLINIIVEKKLNAILPDMIDSQIKKYLESGIQPDMDDFEDDDDLKSLLLNPKSSNAIIRDNSITKKTQTEEKKYAKNPVINKILNETAQNFTGLAKDPTDTLGGGSYQSLLAAEYENVGEEFSFNTKNMGNVINRPPVAPQVKTTVNNLKNQVAQETGAAPAIVDAMVKDYSKILKKANSLAKSKRGGGLPLRSGVGEDW